MVLHGYERTGIKENKQLKESKEQMLKKKRQQENLQITKDRTTYNQDVAKKYDTSLMNRDKECKKIEMPAAETIIFEITSLSYLAPIFKFYHRSE